MKIDIFEEFKKALPPMSRTEREALMAGDTWFDKELFSGKPNWDDKIYNSKPKLSQDEIAFLNGPVEELCEMLDDYDINHHRADLPDHVWDFLKKNKFFGMIISKEYGGLGFSARGHSEVVIKIATRSIAAAVTVMVPNSLGPAELLLHYGTQEEKDKYLNNLATGQDIPCFALTSPHAGSDAANLPDVGYIGKGSWDGEEVIGLYLTFDKRYITLAPIATLMGLAFKVEDPYSLMNEYNNGEIKDKDISGITVALIPTDVSGIEIGERHNPLGIGFLNGPVRGKDVFVPLSMVLGGPKNIGQGWKMLMECLSVGRSVSLPSLACAGGKKAVRYVGAYARVRKQFGLPISKFEGVEEALARIVGLTQIMDSARKMTLHAVDKGKKPSVLSAICKYHLTEMNRQVINDAMDITAGSGICLGPKNLFGNSYQSLPISITVEGANILTRGLMIFGQGSIRNHPYIQHEMEYAARGEKELFYKALKSHISHTLKNFGRGLIYNVLGCLVPRRNHCGYTPINRFSATYAFVTDVTMLLLQGSLKRRERISARLGDILSYMYLLSAVLYDPKDTPAEKWAEAYLLYNIQESFYSVLENYPNKWIGKMLLRYAFPYGRTYKMPNDKLDHNVVQSIMVPGKIRDELTEGVFISENENDQTAKLEYAFQAAELFDPIERIVRKMPGATFDEKADNAVKAGKMVKASGTFAKQLHLFLSDVIQVDDFEVV